MSDPNCKLTEKHCVPCEGGAAPLTATEITPLLSELTGWKVEEGRRIVKDYEFKNFAEAIEFVHWVGRIAEAEGHHPDIFLHDYKHVTLTLYTHAIGGLSENDFIVAAKVDERYAKV